MLDTFLPAAFYQHFQYTPQLLVRAPGRINLIGEHTDYNEGFVLPAAIDKAIYFAVGGRPDDRLRFHALDLQETFEGRLSTLTRSPDHPWANYLLGVLSEATRDGLPLCGLDVVFGGDIPLGAGLSSSAALESGLVFALDRLSGWHLERPALARLAQRAENNFVGTRCGIMDMFASLLGRRSHAFRLDCRSLEFSYVPIGLPEYSFLLCDTGVRHRLADSEYNTRRAECERGVALLGKLFPDDNLRSLRDLTPALVRAQRAHLPEAIFRRCLFVTQENERLLAACTALEAGDFPAFGALLYQSHEGLRDLYEVSCTESDFLVDTARADTAVPGARQMGGGFGGCTLNLIRNEAVATFQEKTAQAYHRAFGIEPVFHRVNIVDGVGAIE